MSATTKTKTSTCPSWCDWQHHGNASDTKGGHSHTVLGSRPAMTSRAWPQVIGDEAPKLFVEVPDDMTLTPDQALRVAAALIEGVRLAGITR